MADLPPVPPEWEEDCKRAEANDKKISEEKQRLLSH